MAKELGRDSSWYAIVQKGQTFVGLAADATFTIDWNTVTLADKIADWIAKHEPKSASYAAIARESARRQAEAAAVAEAKRAEQQEREAERQERRMQAYQDGSSLEFPSVLDRPKYENFYTYPEGEEPTVWNREHDAEAYDEAQAQWEASWNAYRQAVAEAFDSMTTGSTLTATDCLVWKRELSERGLYPVSEGLLVFPYELDELDGNMVVNAIALDVVDYSYVGTKSFGISQQLELIASGEPFTFDDVSTSRWYDGEASRIRITMRTRTERKHELTVSLDWNVDRNYETREQRTVAVAEIGTGGTHRTAADTKVLANMMLKAIAIAEAWEAQPTTVKSLS